MGLDMRGWGMGGWEGGEARGALGDGCMEVGEVGMGCGLGMPRVAPAPHSEAGPGFWLLGKADGGGGFVGEGEGKVGGEQGGPGGLGSADSVASVWGFSRLFLFSSRLLFPSIFLGGGFGSSSSTGVHLGDLRILAMYLGRRRRIGGCRK